MANTVKVFDIVGREKINPTFSSNTEILVGVMEEGKDMKFLESDLPDNDFLLIPTNSYDFSTSFSYIDQSFITGSNDPIINVPNTTNIEGNLTTNLNINTSKVFFGALLNHPNNVYKEADQTYAYPADSSDPKVPKQDEHVLNAVTETADSKFIHHYDNSVQLCNDRKLVLIQINKNCENVKYILEEIIGVVITSLGFNASIGSELTLQLGLKGLRSSKTATLTQKEKDFFPTKISGDNTTTMVVQNIRIFATYTNHAYDPMITDKTDMRSAQLLRQELYDVNSFNFQYNNNYSENRTIGNPDAITTLDKGKVSLTGTFNTFLHSGNVLYKVAEKKELIKLEIEISETADKKINLTMSNVRLTMPKHNITASEARIPLAITYNCYVKDPLVDRMLKVDVADTKLGFVSVPV